jgi:hypothetical protein
MEWTKVNTTYPAIVVTPDCIPPDSRGQEKAEALLCHSIAAGWRFLGCFGALDSPLTVKLALRNTDTPFFSITMSFPRAPNVPEHYDLERHQVEMRFHANNFTLQYAKLNATHRGALESKSEQRSPIIKD